MPDANISYAASGAIAPCRFVRQGGADFTASQAVAGSVLLGISQEGSQSAPGLTGVTTFPAAEDGIFLKVYGDDDSAMLDIGATVSGGNLLKSDANGMGIPVTTNNDFYGARALESCVSGGRCRVRTMLGYYGA